MNQKKLVTAITPGALALIVASLMAPVVSPKVAGAEKPAPGTTAESALAADDELTKALRDNDPDGIARLLSDD